MSLKYQHTAARFLTALLLLGAAGSAVAQSLAFPRLLLGVNGPTNRIFTAGDVVTPVAQLDSNVWYKIIVRDGVGNVLNPTFPCMAGTAFASTNSYVVQPNDPPSTNAPYTFVIEEFANGACSGAAIASKTQQFYVVTARAYTNSALTALTNRFTRTQTAYLRLDGLPPSSSDWSVTWFLPSGSSSCANTSNSDRPDSIPAGRLPSTYLAYPPSDSFSDNWNKAANYDGGGGCDSFSSVNEGQWQLKVQLNLTNFVTLRAFVMSNDCFAPTVDITDRTVCAGGPTTFTAVTNGTGPLTFVWRKDGVTIPVTSRSFTISPVNVSTAGVYTVEVTGPCGKATNSATLTVNTPVTSQPLSDESVCAGEAVTFVAITNGSGPFTFQWRKGTTNLAGETGAALTIGNPVPTNSGNYNVIISGACNSVTNSGKLTVYSNLALSPLTNAVRYVGTVVSFSTTPSGGNGTNTYVWLKDGIIIPNETNRTLTLTNVTVADGGTYTVVAHAGCGAAQSATLLVAHCFESLDVMLVIDRSGSMIGQPYVDARTAATNLIHNLVLSTNSDLVGLVSFNPIGTLNQTLTNSAPALEQAVHTLGPATNGTCVSCGITTAQTELNTIRHRSGALPVMLILSDGVPHDFDTPSNALYNATAAKMAGTRVFTIGLNDGSGTNVDANLLTTMASSSNDFFYATSSSRLPGIFDEISALLCRGPNDIVGPSPTNTTVCVGADVEFTVAASGCALFTFQWSKQGTMLPGQTNNILYLPNVTAADAGVYDVIISSFCGTITNSATLTVNTSPQIIFGPMSQTRCAGASVSFNVSAGGTGLSYQWWHDFTPLPGQTNTTLTLTNLAPADAGFYYAVVSSPCGTPVATSAQLTVNTPPVLTPLGDVAACPNQLITFQTTATGTGPFTYVWRKNGAVISSAATDRLMLAPANALSVGTYSVEVTGVCGAATNSASLILLTNTTATPLVSLTRCVGTVASFATVPAGTGPFTFVWRKDGVILPGAANPFIILSSVALTNAGTYSVEVQGACQTVTNSATLAVNALTTASAPTNVAACGGDTVSFSTVPQGTGPFSLAWRKNGVLVNGATNTTLTISNVGPGDVGTYAVVVTGLCNATTNTATLTLLQNTTASALSNATRCVGEPASFITTPAGAGPFNIVWRKNGAALTNETNATLSFASVTTNEAGVYSVEVTGACNAVTNSASLFVNEPTTASPLANTTACSGEIVSFSAVPQGTGPFTFIWRKDGVAIDGATNAGFTIFNAAVGDSATYAVEVTGMCNAVTNSATLLVRALTTAVALPDSARCAGESASFTATPSGAGPFTFAWRKDGVLIPEVVSETLFFTNLVLSDAGTYGVEITGACGAVTNVTKLVVNGPPSALIDQTRCAGESAVFTTTTSGDGPFTFAWRKGGALLLNETNSTLALSNLISDMAGSYFVEVTAPCGTFTNSALLTVLEHTSATGMANQAHCVGATVTFTTFASGSGPFRYLWSKDGAVMAGQTNSSIMLSNVSVADTARYSAEVAGCCSSATNSATLTVIMPAAITALTNLSICGVQDVLFAPLISGNGAYTLLWRKDGTVLAGETNATLLISAANASHAGVYSLEVYGSCGNATNSAVLSISTNAVFATLSNQTHCAGATAVFAAEVSGEGPFAFIWKKAGEVISNATTSVLELANLSQADSGVYTVEVIGGCDTATASATLTVNATVTATPLQNLNACTGGSAVFNTTAGGGAGPYGFVWRKNGVALMNQTNSTLILTNVTSTNAGIYSVEVIGCGRVTNLASLSISSPVAATLPTNIVACVCDDLVLAPTVNGVGPFACVWRKNGVVLAGETNSSLLLPMLNTLSAGNYTLELYGPCNSVTNTTSLQVINVTSGRWSNTNVLVIPLIGAASIYPSKILIQCAPKVINRLEVTLHGLTHAFPDDVDIMLLAPNGTAIKLMSDCGGIGNNAISNVDLTFSATATAFLSDNAMIRAGNFLPSDYPNDIDPFQSPAPANANATSLLALYGTNPNGYWSLFVVDDHGNGAGSLKGWTLDFGEEEFVMPNVWLSSPEVLPNGAFQMQLYGTQNKTYYVEASVNYTNWTIIQTNYLPTGSATIIDYTAPQFGYRFYRATGCRD